MRCRPRTCPSMRRNWTNACCLISGAAASPCFACALLCCFFMCPLYPHGVYDAATTMRRLCATLEFLRYMRRISPAAAITLLILLLAIPGCRNNKRYRLQGKVLAKDKSQLTVVHKEIPGFMPAMTMPYQVKDAAVIEEVEPGDGIAADIVTSGSEKDRLVWLENVVITEEHAHGPAAQNTDVNYLNAGAAVPDFVMTNQDGKQIRLSQFHEKAVLLTFIYTRCPLPEFCPRLTSQFAALHRQLTTSVDEARKTHLITVTPILNTIRLPSSGNTAWLTRATQRAFSIGTSSPCLPGT